MKRIKSQIQIKIRRLGLGESILLLIWIWLLILFIILILILLLLSFAGGRHATGVAADDGYLQALADPHPMTIDADHRARTGPIFRADERIAMWMNVPGGGAAPFITG